ALQSAIEEEFRRRGTLEVIPDKEGDLVLSGRIIRYWSNPIAFNGTLVAKQFQGNLGGSVKLTERATGRVLYDNPALQESTDFGAVTGTVVSASPRFQDETINARDLVNLTNVQIGESRRRTAIDELVQQVAREVYLYSMEPFSVPAHRAVQPRTGDPLALLARGAPRAAYLLHGDESYLIERALAGLRERITGAARILWAPEDSVHLPAALDDLSSLMLFGGSQMLVIRRAEALSAKDEDLVLAAAGRAQPPACLILAARGLDGRRRMLAAFEREGAAFAFPRVTDPVSLREWIGRLAGERGQ